MKNEILVLATKAVRIPSTADLPAALNSVLSLFLRVFEKNKCVVIRRFRHKGKQSAIIVPKGKTPRVWLNAHLDVVPGKQSLFKPKLTSGKLVGRGVLDMKLAAACFAVLTQKMTLTGINVGLMLVTDEEIGGHNGTKMLIDKGLVSARFVIAGEPTNLEIGNQAKGQIQLEIISTGKSAHGSRVWLGDNAIQKLVPDLIRLEKTFPRPQKESWQTTVNLGVINGGKIFNQVPDQCSVLLDIRYLPAENPTRLISRLRNIFKSHKVIVKALEKPIFTDRKNPYLISFADAYKEVVNSDPIFRKGHGSSDIRFFTAKNIPAIAFGLRGVGLHSDKEWVSLAEINTYCEVLKQFIQKHQ